MRGETITRMLQEPRGQKLRYFRHPFLDAGATAEDKAGFEALPRPTGLPHRTGHGRRLGLVLHLPLRDGQASAATTALMERVASGLPGPPRGRARLCGGVLEAPLRPQHPPRVPDARERRSPPTTSIGWRRRFRERGYRFVVPGRGPGRPRLRPRGPVRGRRGQLARALGNHRGDDRSPAVAPPPGLAGDAPGGEIVTRSPALTSGRGTSPRYSDAGFFGLAGLGRARATSSAGCPTPATESTMYCRPWCM